MRRAMMAAALLCVAGATACVKKEVASSSPSALPGRAGVGPSLVVEQFLRAANSKDLARMAQLFGTAEGPIGERDPRTQVEQRMFAISSVLQHEDFEIQGEQIVPGRTSEATILLVKLSANGKNYSVPFTMVRYKQSNWLVEQVGIDVITSPRD